MEVYNEHNYYWNDIRCRFFYNIYEYYTDKYINELYYYHSMLSYYNEELNNSDNQRVDGSLSFMRNAVYEYNDELWEELNNGPIASSEMSFDNSSVVIDSSDSVANNLNTPSIIQLNNKTNDSTNNNEDNNIINVITNPQTGIKGLLVLIISLITVIGTSLIVITKKVRK